MIFPFHRLRAVVMACGFAASLAAAPGSLEYFFTSAASYSNGVTSNEALPIGNGKLAAMIYGGVTQETIQFNEDTVWMGTVRDYSHPGAVDWLDDIRNYVWLGQGANAYSLAAKDNFMSIPLRQSPYQPTGNLRINFPSHSSSSNYRRSLDLNTAVAKVTYTSGGVTYTRETFASYPDKVIVIRLTSSAANSLSFNYTFDTIHTRITQSTSGTDLILNGTVNDDKNANRQTPSEIQFQGRVRILNDGGTVTAGSNSVAVANANSVTLLLSAATNFVRFNDLSADPEARVLAILDAADDKAYATLRADHLADYQELFNRVTIDLNGTSKESLPMNTRLDAIDVSANNQAARAVALKSDLNLVELNFQMGRYLLISGSRPGSQPLTLQGKWNNETEPAWESKMTLNINQEMNYWLAEVANLAECHEPMVDLVKDLALSGQKVAETHYGAGGWMVHHNTDLWRAAAPINNPGGLWPSGGAWLSMHLWWHYDFNRDPATLTEIYPLMKGAAEFFDDFLIPDPRPGRTPYLLTNPSHSPEQPNPALGDDGELVAGTTMDNALIRNLYNDVIKASEMLGVDAEERAVWQSNRDQLPPHMIGRFGQIQEWLEDVDTENNQHRHLSPLVGMFPGDEITPQATPELAAAVLVNLDDKGDATNNTSWSMAWKMNLRSSMNDGDHAFGIYADLLAKSHTDNLVFSRKGNENQIDGNMGSAAALAAMFLQSDKGEIELLPALPSAFPSGRITGLKARGGYTVDMSWAAGALTEATIKPVVSGVCRVRSAVPINIKKNGELVPAPEVSSNLYQFTVDAGVDYVVAAGEPFEGNGDSDGDGLADTVETNTGIYVSPSDTGTNPNLADSDGDALSDGDEVNTYGTNPVVKDLPAMGVEARSGGVFVQLQGINGVPYSIQSASSLGGEAWSHHSATTGTGASQEIQVAAPAADAPVFYRAVQNPPQP